jgi:hypothetical protein
MTKVQIPAMVDVAGDVDGRAGQRRRHAHRGDRHALGLRSNRLQRPLRLSVSVDVDVRARVEEVALPLEAIEIACPVITLSLAPVTLAVRSKYSLVLLSANLVRLVGARVSDILAATPGTDDGRVRRERVVAAADNNLHLLTRDRIRVDVEHGHCQRRE